MPCDCSGIAESQARTIPIGRRGNAGLLALQVVVGSKLRLHNTLT